ncbi:hypothetical protein MCUN1_001567 [Malassezia cuniculi]|uniref:Adenosylmethionine-8-amino-7-oxononanoate aminotransferase n=1 Tax=Malassezia cuniculi TaxID=948313 RepID=A0AAF0J5Z3_9BASI|nr:hypothetical protein MCUN1_001567 [Malassezia cuniculi]
MSLPEEPEAIVQGVAKWIQEESARGARATAVYIESAGGVHSPAPSGTSQADLLRPLRLPVVLVGSSELGGISTTRSAFESLRMRGYDVDAVLMFPSRVYENDAYLRQWLLEEYGIPVFTLGGPNGSLPGAPPARASSDAADVAAMKAYYAGLIVGAPDAQLSSAFEVVSHLRACHAKRIEQVEALPDRVQSTCWWPFTQHERISRDDVLVIDSAHGDHFAARDASGSLAPVLDGSSSWWTQALGHGNPRLAQAAAYAAGRYGHVIFPGAAHAPAADLAEAMLSGPGKGWASRVFFSDDGSTATEIAIKMAIQSAARRYAPRHVESDLAKAKLRAGNGPGSMSGRPEQEFEILGLDGSYHGDTIGAMDACSPNVFNEQVAWYRGRGHWLRPPTVHIAQGTTRVSVDGREYTFESLAHVLDVESRLSTELAGHYRASIRRELERLVVVEGRRFGALMLEPLVMGAGGMVLVDPLYQRCLVDVVRSSEDLFSLTDPPLRSGRAPTPKASEQTWRGLPVIYDEVFSGLYRLGPPSAAHVLGVQPDIACYAKILSGGLVPLALTLASSSIFDTFSHPEKKRALLHGHSYTAHPVGCTVALETLAQIDALTTSPDWEAAQADWDTAAPGWSLWSREQVLALSHSEHVTGVWALGTVLALELGGDSGYQSSAAESLVAGLRQHGIHVRPLGNVVYIMCSLNTPAPVLRSTERILSTLLGRA